MRQEVCCFIDPAIDRLVSKASAMCRGGTLTVRLLVSPRAYTLWLIPLAASAILWSPSFIHPLAFQFPDGTGSSGSWRQGCRCWGRSSGDPFSEAREADAAAASAIAS